MAPAGSCSFHHVRAVHGSAQDRSAQSRNLLLYEFTAADLFALLGIPDRDEFNSRLLVGTPTLVPRTVDCPIRMPLPPAAPAPARAASLARPIEYQTVGVHWHTQSVASGRVFDRLLVQVRGLRDALDSDSTLALSHLFAQGHAALEVVPDQKAACSVPKPKECSRCFPVNSF